MKNKHIVSTIFAGVILYGIYSVISNPNVLGGIITDLPFQAFNLLFLLLPFGKAYVDVFLFQKKGKEVKHKNSLLVAVMVGTVLAGFDSYLSGVHYIQSALLAIGYHFFFFDPVRNLMAGEEIHYVDSNPKSDKVEDSWFDVNLYSYIPPVALVFVRCFVLILTLSAYYLKSLIF